MTQTAKHTPGPWWPASPCAYEILARDTNNNPITICQMSEGDDGAHIADARLIAAAPELLAALKDVIGPRDIDAKHQCAGCGRVYDEPEDTTLAFCPADDCANHIARAAIAKCGGR